MSALLFLLVVLNDAWIALRCGAKFMVRGAVSDFFPTPRLLSRRTELAWFLVYLYDTYRQTSQSTNNRGLKRRLEDRLAIELSRQPPPTVEPIPEYEVADLSPDRVRELVSAKSPFIVRGFFAGSKAVREWSVERFIERYGDVDVLCGRDDVNIHAFQPLRSIRESGTYARNMESLFLHDPSLVRDLELERFADHAFDRDGRWFHSMQLFVGDTVGASSAYHCAKMDNFFAMIEGRKRWWFVNPLYTHAMAPFFNPGMGYFESTVGHPDAPEPELALYAHVPRLEGELEAGDLLYSPPLWWHATRNTTRENIAVSTRWYASDTETYFPLSLLQVFCIRSMPVKMMFSRDLAAHVARFGFGTNLHPDRNYVSIRDEASGHTLFELASHQVDYRHSMRLGRNAPGLRPTVRRESGGAES